MFDFHTGTRVSSVTGRNARRSLSSLAGGLPEELTCIQEPLSATASRGAATLSPHGVAVKVYGLAFERPLHGAEHPVALPLVRPGVDRSSKVDR